jgi:uncharacterized protein (DUF488 family)
MKLFTIGYGGRTMTDFLALLSDAGVQTVVDVRLRPDRASMGIWVKAKTADKGIEKTLHDAGIGYRSLIELGNIFLDCGNCQDRYRQLLDAAGELLISRLEGVPEPFCLLCAEKLVADCHRGLVADYLAQKRGAEVIHIK